ncbi:MAG: TonB-dependent receptor [Verrucomicrobiota bacterium]
MKTILSLAVIATSALSAQTEAGTVYELDPVIVTGELWASELERSTASITLLGSEQIEESGAGHFQDIVNAIPNLTWTGGTSRPRYIQIRGIGENSQFEGETPDSSVRFLIDDLDFTGIGTIGNLFDVEQVEVLRGPQAGAYGVNAAGGIVKIVSAQPTNYWTGQVEGTIGDDNLFGAGLAIGGPLIESDPETLTFRFSIHQQLSDGFRDNRFLNEEDTNERDELTSRLKVRWKANQYWQWDATLFYADADNGYDEFSLDNTGFDTFSDQPGRDEQESLAGSLRGSWTGADSFELTSITSYSDSDSLYSYDADWTDTNDPRTYNGFLSTERERDVFTQELRIDSADREDALGWIDRWTVGLYFHELEEDTALEYGDDFGADLVDATVNTNYEASSQAAFGQIAHDLSEKTRLVLGLRLEHYDIEVDSTGSSYGFPIAGISDQDGTLWGGKITLEHDLNDAQRLFTSFARGYKAGGANVATFADVGDPLTYEDEILYNFEVGLRSKWFGQKVATQLTFFYMERQDTQLRDSQGAGGFFRYLTVNGEDASHFGMEAEATWYLSKNLTASAGIGLLDTERDAYNDPGGLVPSRSLANSPDYSYNVRLDYKADNGIFANIETVGSDAYYESNSHNQKRDRFNVVNAAIGYRYENWTLTVWGRNLLDEGYEKRVFFFANEGPFFADTRRYESPADPRQIGATVKYSW